MLTDLPTLQGICDDQRHLSRIEAFLRERDIGYVTYQDWKILDQYEAACGATQGRPRIKVTTVSEMMAVIRGQSSSPPFTRQTGMPKHESSRLFADELA
jgi:ferredoxin--NADP+ reductase